MADRSEIAGTCTVVLYGAHHHNNIAAFALLIPEGGQYTFAIYWPAYNYRTIKGVPATDAVEMAEKFVGWHPEFIRSQMSKIFDNNGQVIAYEVRPLYEQTTFGVQDVKYLDHSFEDNDKVVVHIRLADQAERVFMGNDQGKVHWAGCS